MQSLATPLSLIDLPADAYEHDYYYDENHQAIIVGFRLKEAHGLNYGPMKELQVPVDISFFPPDDHLGIVYPVNGIGVFHHTPHNLKQPLVTFEQRPESLTVSIKPITNDGCLDFTNAKFRDLFYVFCTSNPDNF